MHAYAHPQQGLDTMIHPQPQLTQIIVIHMLCILWEVFWCEPATLPRGSSWQSMVVLLHQFVCLFRGQERQHSQQDPPQSTPRLYPVLNHGQVCIQCTQGDLWICARNLPMWDFLAQRCSLTPIDLLLIQVALSVLVFLKDLSF